MIDEAVGCFDIDDPIYDTGFCDYYLMRERGFLRLLFEMENDTINPAGCPMCADQGFVYTIYPDSGPDNGRLRTNNERFINRHL